MLPIYQVLEPLQAALEGLNAAVLAAPPGAGKTTIVPTALLNAPWTKGGRIILLEPRRLAARAAARRLALGLGEAVGDTVGVKVRLETIASARTRLLVVTEGVFTRMVLEDPGLDGVAGVIFDEFHERSLEGDLGLALALQSQRILREDLRLLVMSATLDTGRIAALLGGAPVIVSDGRQHSVRTVYVGRGHEAGVEAQTARAVRKALAEEGGGILAFLPGQGEIRRVEALLRDRLPAGVDLAPLYGALSAEAQDAAIAPAPPGRRKVVLATSIAETSLTIEGVRVVVDSGLARTSVYDAARGGERLDTVRVSRASADQRRGRAGRTEPGVCYRVWDEEETRGLAPFAPPQILQADLSGFALDLALFGVRDPGEIALLDPPPPKAFDRARALLVSLGALDALGLPTPDGERLGRIPLAPRLARLVLEGAKLGAGVRAAEIALLLTERGLGGSGVDLEARVEGLARDRSPRAAAARRLAGAFARTAGAPQARGGTSSPPTAGRLLLSAFPERLGRRRGRHGEFLLASGRGAFVDPAEPLAGAVFLVAADVGGGAVRDRVLLAAQVSEAEVYEGLEGRLSVEERVEPGGGGRLVAVRRVRHGALVLEETSRPADPGAMADALLERVRAEGLGALAFSPRARSLQARAAFLRGLGDLDVPDISDLALLADLEAFAGPLLAGRRALEEVTAEAVEEALEGRLGWEGRRILDLRAPPRFSTPAGSSVPIAYDGEGGPRAEVRVQELFGLTVHPAVAGGRAPLALSLTSPARRPLQITRDLPGFWRGSWSDVRREMRGRYPRHPWPEDPAAAPPTSRAKPRGT